MSASQRPFWNKEEDRTLVKYVLGGGSLSQTKNLLEGRTQWGCRGRYKNLEREIPTEEQKEEFKVIYAAHKDDVWKSVLEREHIVEPWKGLPAYKEDLPEGHWYNNGVSRLQYGNVNMWDIIAQIMQVPHAIVDKIFWSLDEKGRAGQFEAEY